MKMKRMKKKIMK